MLSLAGISDVCAGALVAGAARSLGRDDSPVERITFFLKSSRGVGDDEKKKNKFF